MNTVGMALFKVAFIPASVSNLRVPSSSRSTCAKRTRLYFDRSRSLLPRPNFYYGSRDISQCHPSFSPGKSRHVLLARLGTAALLQTLTNLFPVWISVGSTVAFFNPASFLWFRSSYIVPTLSLIMLGMGLTISPSSFSTVFETPRDVVLGACAQYTLMPLIARTIASLLHLPPALAAGVILVGVCPGGAASNIICLLARSNVPLSVVLTMVSTLLSVLLIPSLMYILAGTLVPIAPLPLLTSTAQVVLFPILLGCALQKAFPRLVAATSIILPLVSVLGVTAICGAVIASNAAALSAVGPSLVLAIALMHALGGLAGYSIAAIFGLDIRSRRTVSIEVMMQNSSLAVSLANSHFLNPATAIPGAISATLHSVFGSILAAIWRFTPVSSGETGRDKIQAAVPETLSYRELDE